MSLLVLGHLRQCVKSVVISHMDKEKVSEESLYICLAHWRHRSYKLFDQQID